MARFCIVGIGASAGGLEAICDFFEAMPADSGIAFIVIQHLLPTQKSLAAEIISRHTTISVQPAEDGMLVEANHIYTIPPNTYPSLRQGRLHLEAPTNTGGPRLPIDHFFASLGNDQHEAAIGIILSGSGTDGSQGLKQIEENGGMVLVQAPDTALFNSMPRSAIDTGLVHCVLPAREMPAALARFVSHNFKPRRSEILSEAPERDELAEILNIILRRRGYNFSGYKRNTMTRRVRRRMGLHSINSVSDYAILLDADASEVDALLKDMLIGVTEFFRDPEAWQELKKSAIAPMVAAKKSGEPIRVWVPGCSTGEEAYSIAILMLEALRQAGKRCPLMVFATDTNDEALQMARLGNYPLAIITHVPAEHLQHYFVENTTYQRYQVNKLLRETVIFGKQNLMSDPPFSKVDLICCRNLLIYLEADIQKKMIALFRFALHPGGYIFLGSSETLGKHTELFAPISKKWRIYRHIDSYASGDIQLPILQTGKALPTLELPQPLNTEHNSARPSQLAKLTQQLLLEQFSPAAVLINSNFEILYFSGPTENYLQMPRGAPTNDLLSQARDGLRSRLRNALREAVLTGKLIVVEEARVRRKNSYQPVRFSVVPTANGDDGSTLFLIVFEDLARSAVADTPGNENLLVRQLEDELRATKDDLKISVEQFEAANENLKVSNLEVVSINEELQSINEELESSKEELQSLNEELTTVNQQLQMKIADLESRNTDMNNLLESSQIATLCLDRDNRIKWFSPSMKAIVNVIPEDIGRPITDFSQDILGGNLIEDGANVLATLTPLQCELMLRDEHCYLRRVVPYRTDGEHFGGVVITYTDITEAKQAALSNAASLRELATSLEQRVRERTLQLRTLTAELALTEERERRMLARDLHDDLGQVLAIVKLKLSSMEESERRGALKMPLNEIEALIDQANRSVRSLLLQLCPPTLQTLGIIPALEWLGDEMERLYGLKVHVDAEGDLPPLAEPERTTIFRAIRELLINVAKHAKTDKAEINCHKRADGHISISVTDQGLGFDHQKALSAPVSDRGFGLMSVAERIEFIGGEMIVDTMPGFGTTVTIIFPSSHGAIL